VKPNQYLPLLAVSSALGGLLETPDELPGGIELALILADALLLYGWCKAHAKAHHVAEPSYAAVFCALAAPIGVPLYFIRAFGPREGTVRTLRAAGFFVVLIGAYEGGALLREWIST